MERERRERARKARKRGAGTRGLEIAEELVVEIAGGHGVEKGTMDGIRART